MKMNATNKKETVYQVFTRVAKKYDRMNDVMSGGMHRFWKNVFVENLFLHPRNSGKYFLDMAGGTGDIARRIYKKVHLDEGRLTVADINRDMLDIGKCRFIDENCMHKNVEFVLADAEDLPFHDNVYDFYTIAFGLRNVSHPQKALEEAHRVLKYGGRFFCLEFSMDILPFLKEAYNAYSSIVPYLGKYYGGDKAAYQYLVESIRGFYSSQELRDRLQCAGFSKIGMTPLSGGIVFIHWAWKL